MVLLVLAVARQFFDWDTQCLRPGEQCEDTQSDFKDDILEPPTPGYPSDELEDVDPFNEVEIWEA